MAIIKKFRIKSFKNNKEVVKLENISFSFGERKILENINISVNRGEIVGLLGPNGVGKSTIFNLILGMIKPGYGSIKIDTKIVNDYPIYLRSKKFRIGYCPQYAGFIHDLNVADNLKAIGEIKIDDKNRRDEKINLLIAKFELDAVRNVKAKHLSGGLKKRLSIALALLGDPKILLLDEPFAALDVLTIKKLQEIIVDLQSEYNISVMLTDHQAADLLKTVDKAIVISNCNVIASGTPSEIVKNIDAKEAYFGDSFQLK